MTITTESPDETGKIGERLGKLLQGGNRIYLTGTLGAGKTCLALGIARGWGAVEHGTSPTFTLINEYHRPDGNVLYHVDCYRLSSVPDALSTGLEDVLDSISPLVVEWPERIEGILPAEALWIAIGDERNSHRKIVFTARGNHAAKLLADLKGKR